jgi:uncharacterized protein (DUF488 family)
MSETIHTIGHSTHTSDAFISLLIPHRITAVADVRSTPYSRRNPQFNREKMRAALKVHGIQYVFLGRELGARSEDDCCYVNDKVRYSLLAQTPLFRSGIERLLDGARSQRIALVCAERDPLDCHRTILIARELVACGVGVLHILSDGSIEPHDDALRRLVGRLKMRGEDLFRSQSITLEEAYDRQAERIAFDRNRHRAGLRSSTFNETKDP